ncbi:hypothetical protein BJX65DRAFT_258278 [Aspergillus insuetus]
MQGLFTRSPTGNGPLDISCMDWFRTIINPCDKYCGSLQVACVLYQTIALDGDKLDPTGAIPSGFYGDGECEHTDNEGTLRTPAPAGSRSFPDRTEIFGKLKSGKCEDIDYRPA